MRRFYSALMATTIMATLVFSSEYTNASTKSISIKNVILAKSALPGYSREQLELVDVKGTFTDNSTLGPFQGPNWTGQFQLRQVSPTGKILSIFNLPNNKYTQMLFMSKFSFHFADYNGDGNPDFTLGQYRSSNGYIYRLFTVTKRGLFQLQTVPAEVFASDTEYSPSFPKLSPNEFRVKYYDNSKPGWLLATYTWKGKKFVRSSLKAVLE